MDSVGAILKKAREDQGLSLNQVSSATHILPCYIQALEENRFQDLPGETYCAGFIGSLARYYKLDSRPLVSMFRGIPKEEREEPKPERKAPVIMTEKRHFAKLIRILVVLVVLVAAVCFIFAGGKRGDSSAVPKAQEEHQPNVFVMDEVLFERSFAENDIVQIRLGSISSDIVCKSIGNSVVLGTSQGNVTLAQSQELVLDLDGDSNNDVKVSLKDVFPQERTAVIRIDRTIEAPVPPPLPTVTITPKAESTIMHDKGTVPILVSPEKRNFIFEIDFSGPCYFRYQPDGAESVEKYCRSGDQVHLEVTEEIKVWLSNAGNARIRIGDAEIMLGNLGDVTSERIGWEATADKTYTLSIVSMH